MTRKDVLLKELAEIEQKEYNDFIKENYPKFNKFVGKCFKIKTSVFSTEIDNDYWYFYYKILKIDESDLYVINKKVDARFHGISFMVDKNEQIIIEFDHIGYINNIETDTEISNDEFKTAWLDLQTKLSTIDIYI